MEISGTEVRARRRAGRSIRYLVPEAVRTYIETHDLYATPR
jgi:nicotinate-nucleotide adenylyltransferase